jgi:uncharacterized protein (TIGR02145 family)
MKTKKLFLAALIFSSLLILQSGCKKDKDEESKPPPANNVGGNGCEGITTVNHGGQIYNTVEIGNQCWLKENLNIGTRINDSQNQTNNQTIEKYCYDNNEANCDEYGGLYQWNEMMQYTTTQGTQGICPTGWHIPTDNEWKILEGTIDSQYGVGDTVWDHLCYREYDAGKKLKSTSGWISNGNGSDTYGLRALPGGYSKNDGYFSYIEEHAFFWSSTEYDSNHAWYRYLWSVESGVGRYYSTDNYGKGHGFSVRCLKD